MEERDSLTPTNERNLDPTIITDDKEEKSSPPRIDVAIDGVRVGKLEVTLSGDPSAREVATPKEPEETGRQADLDFTSTMRMFSKGVEKLNSMMVTSEAPDQGSDARVASDCDAKSTEGPAGLRMLFQDGSQPGVKSDYLIAPDRVASGANLNDQRPSTAGGAAKIGAVALSQTGSTSKAKLS